MKRVSWSAGEACGPHTPTGKAQHNEFPTHGTHSPKTQRTSGRGSPRTQQAASGTPSPAVACSRCPAHGAPPPNSARSARRIETTFCVRRARFPHHLRTERMKSTDLSHVEATVAREKAGTGGRGATSADPHAAPVRPRMYTSGRKLRRGELHTSNMSRFCPQTKAGAPGHSSHPRLQRSEGRNDSHDAAGRAGPMLLRNRRCLFATAASLQYLLAMRSSMRQKLHTPAQQRAESDGHERSR